MAGCILAKTILIVSGGIEAIPGIARAKELGYRVIVADGNPAAPGFAYADDHILCSTYDAGEMASAAKHYSATKHRIDGVISIAADVPITVSTVAHEIGLPGHSLETALLSSDKYLMKQRFVEQNIACPWFSMVENTEHLISLVQSRSSKLVIKPVDSRGARGVLLLEPGVDLAMAYQHARENSPTHRVMIEDYLEGPQISTEAILLEDAASCPGFSDRNYEMLETTKPYMIENGGDQPSFLPQDAQDAIRAITIAAGRALGVISGTVKGDIVLTPTGPKVIEIATRMSGGWFCTDQIPLATGVDFVGIAIRIALGEKVDPLSMHQKFQKGAAVRYFFPAEGKIKSIANIEKAKALKGVHKFMMFAKTGDNIAPLSNHTQRAGFVLTVADTNQEAVAIAHQAIATVEFAY
jgi:biotin carboxylase